MFPKYSRLLLRTPWAGFPLDFLEKFNLSLQILRHAEMSNILCKRRSRLCFVRSIAISVYLGNF